MSQPLEVQVCIVGAGPVGGTLACRLAEAGVSVALIDQAALPPMEHPAFDGRAYAIASGSVGLLQGAGLWDILHVPPNPIRGIRVSDARTGRPASRLRLHFDPPGSGADAPPFGWMIEARSLRTALNARFPMQRDLHLFAPSQVQITRAEQGCEATLQDGTVFRSRLVIAADGRKSRLRDQASIGTASIPYRQTAIVCAVAHERPHHDIALEHFLPAGPFAALPMGPSGDPALGGSPHVSALVWTERTANAAAFMALDDTRFAREAGRRLGTHLGAIRAIGRRWSYELSAMIADRYVDTRLALIGDAAHGIHPIAGQGLNLGLRDGMALADLIIAAAGRGDDVGSPALLAQYQRLRRSDNLLMFGMTDQLDRLFSMDRRLVRLTRDLGIAAVNRIEPLKGVFVRRATGATA